MKEPGRGPQRAATHPQCPARLLSSRPDARLPLSLALSLSALPHHSEHTTYSHGQLHGIGKASQERLSAVSLDFRICPL